MALRLIHGRRSWIGDFGGLGAIVPVGLAVVRVSLFAGGDSLRIDLGQGEGSFLRLPSALNDANNAVGGDSVAGFGVAVGEPGSLAGVRDLFAGTRGGRNWGARVGGSGSSH